MPKANPGRMWEEGFLWKSPERMCLPRPSLSGKRETVETLCGEDVPALGPGCAAANCAAANCATSSPRPVLGVTSPWQLELGHTGGICIVRVSKCYKPLLSLESRRVSISQHLSDLSLNYIRGWLVVILPPRAQQGLPQPLVPWQGVGKAVGEKPTKVTSHCPRQSLPRQQG